MQQSQWTIMNDAKPFVIVILETEFRNNITVSQHMIFVIKYIKILLN